MTLLEQRVLKESSEGVTIEVTTQRTPNWID